MPIQEIQTNKKQYIPLLLLADEQESMIDRYLERGRLFVWEDGGTPWAVCVVTDEGDGILEVKNLAVAEELQGRGYGRAMLEFVEDRFRSDFAVLQVGTGDSPATLPFYERCGFRRTHRARDFFTDHYEKPIWDGGVLLRDMVYLRKRMGSGAYPAHIRPIRREEYGLLAEFLYEAIYQGPKAGTLSRTVLQEPGIWRYAEDFGNREGDICAAAEVKGRLVGAAWARKIEGYGFVEPGVPELAMALYPEYRGLGLGGRLLERLLKTLGDQGERAVSLSVQRANPAMELYRKAGFREVRGDGEEAVMVLELGAEQSGLGPKADGGTS